jgi:hypothetical protein
MTGGPGTESNGNKLYEPDLPDDIEMENSKLGFSGFLDPDALARLEDNKVPAFTVIPDIPVYEPFRPCYIMSL